MKGHEASYRLASMKTRLAVIVSTLLLLTVTQAPAWWVKGHGIITEAAVSRLPEEVPPFFRAAGKQIGYLSGEPDRWKNRETPYLRAAESPDHYIDLEDYKDNELPADRYKAGALVARLGGRPERAGMLPYAIMENFDRLTIAFYDYREWKKKTENLETAGDKARPEDKAALEVERKAIEAKCILYAGLLAHYAGDASMPLHTTIHYDGRTDKKGPDGKKLQVGIHAKIDGFPENNGFTPEEVARGVEPKPIDEVWKRIIGTIKESYTHIDRCYELDAGGAIDKPTDDSRKFIMERCRFGAQFLADLYCTAWKKSEKLPPSF
jgi:hypothetical protein